MVYWTMHSFGVIDTNFMHFICSKLTPNPILRRLFSLINSLFINGQRIKSHPKQRSDVLIPMLVIVLSERPRILCANPNIRLLFFDYLVNIIRPIRNISCKSLIGINSVDLILIGRDTPKTLPRSLG